MSRNIGGSLLPSGSAETYREKAGIHGKFQTRPLPDLDTHGLFYARATGPYADHFMLIASHPNGFSCDELANRIVKAWENSETERAMAQFQYILDCGGLGQSRDRMKHVIEGTF